MPKAPNPILMYLDGTTGSNKWRDVFLAVLAKNKVNTKGIYDPTKFADKDANNAARAAASTVLIHIGATRTAGVHTLDLDAFMHAAIAISVSFTKTEVIFDDDGLSKEIAEQMQIAKRRLQKMFPNATIHDSFRDAVDYYTHKFTY